MITTWLAITLAIIGVGHATCKKGAVLDSVSEIAYIIPHWAFSSWTAIVGILLMPDIMEHLPENWQWIGFFCIVGLCCVAASSYYKTEAKALHYIGGWLCGICATIVVAMTCWNLLLWWLLYLAAMLVCWWKCYTFWAEILVFVLLNIALIFYY